MYVFSTILRHFKCLKQLDKLCKSAPQFVFKWCTSGKLDTTVGYLLGENEDNNALQDPLMLKRLTYLIGKKKPFYLL